MDVAAASSSSGTGDLRSTTAHSLDLKLVTNAASALVSRIHGRGDGVISFALSSIYPHRSLRLPRTDELGSPRSPRPVIAAVSYRLSSCYQA